MPSRNTLAWTTLVALALIGGLAGRAAADMLAALFPDGVPGTGTTDGVTVLSRLHPELMPLGVRAGAWQIFPTLDEGLGYNSNVLPGAGHHGSWDSVTAPAVTINSDWSRNALGATVAVQDTQYTSLPAQDRLDASAAVNGRIDLGDNQLTVAASHIAQHEDRGEVDTIASDRPIAFQVDDFRTALTVNDGRWSIIPSLDIANWTYGNTTIGGLPAREAYRDRLVIQAGAMLRYEWAPLRNLLFVVRALSQDYTHTPIGQSSSNATSYQVMAGFDDNDNDVWRWRLLVGGEVRQFSAPIYAPQNTLIVEAGAGWSPSGMTSVGATVSRETQDAAQEGVSGLILTTSRLTIDHEYLRNVLLKASIGWQQADYFQGGQQTGFSAGAGITWIMNRSARVSLTYDQTDLHGSGSATGSAATGYTRGIGLLTLRLGL